MPNKALLLFSLLMCSSFNLQAFEKTFLDYCQRKGDASCSTPELDHTINVLLEIAETEDCKEAFETLREREFLNLANSGLTDLTPLAGFKKLDHLDISHNNLTNLWGLEQLPQLTIVSAHDNQLTNIAPLAFMINLDTVNLENNCLEFLSPLKELTKLRIYKVEGNPVIDNEIEMTALNGQNGVRRMFPNGFSYDMSLKSTEGIEDEATIAKIKKENKDKMDELVEATARRGDFVFYRDMMTRPKVKARLLDENFLMSAEVRVQKIVLAVSEAEDLAGFLCFLFSSKSKLEPFAKATYLYQRRTQLQKFFEFYLAEGDFFPFLKKDLPSLKSALQKAVEKNIEGDPLHPRFIEFCFKAWEAQFKKTGVPPGMGAGFASM